MYNTGTTDYNRAEIKTTEAADETAELPPRLPPFSSDG
jgi:hypothetical protein